MPDPTQASGLFLATVFGAALGVVAGTISQYFLTQLLERKSKARQKRALVQELIYNRSLVTELAQEAQNLRNAVNGGVLATYFGYFAFSRAIFAQANACTNNGTLYELLNTDDIRHAQRMVSLLSAANETWVNGEITRRRNILTSTPQTFDQAEAVRLVDLVEKQIRDLGRWIDGFIARLH